MCDLKNMRIAQEHSVEKMDKWVDGFERKFKEMDFAQWYKENVLNIMSRFDLHSASGIYPKECLRYFVEKEIMGIE